MKQQTLAFSAAVAVVLVMAHQTARGQDSRLVGSDVSGNRLVSIDCSTGAATEIGPFNQDVVGGAMTGLAYDPVNERLYGIGNQGGFYRVNVSTGRGVFIGNTGLGNPNGLAYDSVHEVLYASNCWYPGPANDLYRVDVTTGAATLVGSVGESYTNVEGLAYSPKTDTLFGVADYQGQLVAIDRVTGAASPLPTALPLDHAWRGLAYDPVEDVIFGTCYQEDAFYRIDPATGAATYIASISATGGIEVQGLAVIPEPATLGLVGLGLSALFMRRRRGARRSG